MCKKCEELDVQIARCKRLGGQVIDKQFLDAVAVLLKDYSAQKAALHSAAA
jgi:hypothetical protein